MASATAVPEKADLAALKDAVYDACLPFGAVVLNQTTLFTLGLIKEGDVQTLLTVTQGLVDDKRFKVVHSEGLGWKLRSKEEARKYRTLSPEQELVYGLIDEAGDEGIWSKTIKARSNLHDAVFRGAIKHLEAKNMISDMKSVEHPMRKMYIKSSIRPSDRATGGPWYSDGELDEEFIAMMMDILFRYIKHKTFYQSSSSAGGATKKPKKVKKMTADEARALRDKELGPVAAARGAGRGETAYAQVDEVEDERAAQRKRKFDRFLPMPAGYQAYPSLDELTAYVENGRFTSQTLSAPEVEQLLDIMCFDGRIERLVSGPDGKSYRALRTSLLAEDDGLHNVLTEAPCGRCPVFDLCEEGGPVGPSNCEYFNDWLDL